MDDKELAIEIERRVLGSLSATPPLYFDKAEWQQIIAALRQANLAQTEIKGHMRVEGELKAELAQAEERLRVLAEDAARAYQKAGDWENYYNGAEEVALHHRDRSKAAEIALDKAQARIAELEKAINTPEIEHFLEGVRLESAHQIERWGTAHDREKSAENWYWLVGYLGGKALRSAITGDRDKALHHCISSAAALMNWHSAIRLDTSGAGIGKDEDIAPDGSKITPIDAALKK